MQPRPALPFPPQIAPEVAAPLRFDAAASTHLGPPATFDHATTFDSMDDNGYPGPDSGTGGPGPKRGKPAGNGADNHNTTKAGKDKGSTAVDKKKTRSKAACSSCKSVKQKCEGPPFVPCRRCELYKLDCQFPPGTKTIPRPPEVIGVGNGGASGPLANALVGEPSPAVAQKLFEIADRLQSIESALHINTSAFASPSHPAQQHHHRLESSSSHHPTMSAASSDAGDEGTAGTASPSDVACAAAANPINEINFTVDSVVGQPGFTPIPGAEDYGAPDVLRRGVLRQEECQQLFDFFFLSIHPWLMNFSLDSDRDALAVRARSPLLFHVILLLSTAYSSTFPSQLHLTLVTFTNNILAPQILSPQPHELTTDFIRALNLLNLYKPVQLGPRRAEGKDDAEAIRVSKVNGNASWMLQGVLARTAERLQLSTSVSKFSRAYSASASGTPIPHALLRDLRLYYCLLWQDVQGNVQSGRRCNMEGAQALTTTRLFSSLNAQPYDVRLAASVEMTELARPILRSINYEKTRMIPKADLDRFNSGMKSFEDTWVPILIRQLAVDPLAMSVVSPFKEFVVMQLNATCYCYWKKEAKLYTGSNSSDASGPIGGSDGGRPASSHSERTRKLLREGAPRGLTDWEFDGLGHCVRSAEALVFNLSEESRVPGAWRKVQWEEAERSDGWRKLVLDDQIVEQSRWGMDAITCISYVFPLVFLAKLVNEGLLTTNLKLLRHATPQPAWLYTQKLPRLLELGSSFLDAIAPNSHHPARSQAQVLRTLLDTGVKGRIPTPTMTAGEIPSTGPSNASTVMSSKIPPPPLPGQGQPQSRPQNFNQNPFPPNPVATYPPQTSPNQLDANSLAAWTSQNQQQPPPQQQQPQGLAGFGQPTPPAQSQGFVPGMDQALQNVLSDFEPLFGVESGQNFWDYGNLSTSSGGSGATPQGYPSGGTPTAGGGGGGGTEAGGIDWSEFMRYSSNRTMF
ncbi:Zn(II)2Cys6 transcription factor [Sporobolomyces koalae]|uniref:Zn(II)2Cys6 transcription factor n=1 Tax=Sporobolomyces koalae TaxID=500713 RepID=UPI00317427BF